MAQKGATGDFFFHFCKKKKKRILKMDNIFPPKKKYGKKEIAAARLASILATRWTGNRLFFMDRLGIGLLTYMQVNKGE